MSHLGMNRLPCANNDASTSFECPNLAKLLCSKCKLVSYCRKECQIQHWAVHKKVCKSPLRSSDWMPNWVATDRKPAFITRLTGDWADIKQFWHWNWWEIFPLSIFATEENEGFPRIADTNLSLGFIASGDLRNVIQTINKLPSDYRGSMNILINDHNPMIVSGISFYSVYCSPYLAYEMQNLVQTHANLGTQAQDIISFGSSTLHSFSDPQLKMFIALHMGRVMMTMSPEHAKKALHAIMLAPSRIDYRDRAYGGLEPSHPWRESGTVLPLGASSAHLTMPNPWMFDHEGKLFLKDSASPLQGWETGPLIQSGKQHGTTREDIIGCFYFHVRDQLQEFRRRMQRFKLNFVLRNDDAIDLAKGVGAGMHISFDRIEVSNICDQEYVGVPRLLEAWGPHLSISNKHAAILGLFMNWQTATPGADLAAGSSARQEKILPLVMDNYPKQCGTRDDLLKGIHAQYNPMMYRIKANLPVCYDHSQFFTRYLNDKEKLRAAQQQNLMIRSVNKIVPSRIGGKLGDPISALPSPETEDEKYSLLYLSGPSFYERYVEWVRIE
ncbi:hypothetical protein DL96DRAFT_1581831 [Flagelloscypha sp. PMI_526]|nr:hypothetical protein DL96DRAFT_1581831 [Flagelloscypha sp. PMI_526]